jgi:hypothetical protein
VQPAVVFVRLSDDRPFIVPTKSNCLLLRKKAFCSGLVPRVWASKKHVKKVSLTSSSRDALQALNGTEPFQLLLAPI